MKTFEGIVVSGGANKTVVVEVSRRTPHPLYRKLIRLSKKLKADTGEFEVLLGNKVKIAETRPISKDKHFKITEIIQEKHVRKITRKVEETAVKKEIKEPVKTVVKKAKTVKKEKK